MNPYVRALRAPFLAGSMVPVLIGSAYAFLQRSFDVVGFLVTAFGVASLHSGSNLLNDYYDAAGSDRLNVRINPFSGGSRVIPDGELGPRTVLAMALACFVFGSAAGVWLTVSGRPLVALIGLAGLAAAWCYSAPPLQLMSRGWGEVLIFFAFGPLITWGTAYVLTGRLSWPAFGAGIPQGFFIAAVIWINQFPDLEADRPAGKRNLVVRLGPGPSRCVYALVMLAAYASVPFLLAADALPLPVVLSLLSLPLGVKAVRGLWRHYDSHERIVPAQALTIRSLAAHGVLLSLGLALGRFWRCSG